jgi:hypothetical protein
MPGFDLNGARQAGYSDDEIIAHLSQSRKFDVDGALELGVAGGEFPVRVHGVEVMVVVKH